jgi:histidine triad (HIT) family protein
MNSREKDPDCIFCKIAAGETDSKLYYQDDDVAVFSDVRPLTPIHLLVVTREHIPSLADMSNEETTLIGKMVKAANKVAKDLGISESGYRLTINSGADAGQVVFHLHMHLMGGRPLVWKH